MAEVNGVGIGGLVIRHTIDEIEEIGGVFTVDVIVAVVKWRGRGFRFVPIEYSRSVVGVVECQKDNFYGTQFHPEKSGDIGEQILANFLKL